MERHKCCTVPYLVSVCIRDAVVGGPEVRGRHDEVQVVVGIVILR